MVSTENIHICKSVLHATSIELVGQLVNTTDSLLNIKVDVKADKITQEKKEMLASGTFSYLLNKVASNPILISAPLSQPTKQSFIGGEKELRALLIERLSPKTIARATYINTFKHSRFERHFIQILTRK